jgi:hypothetical protein
MHWTHRHTGGFTYRHGDTQTDGMTYRQTEVTHTDSGTYRRTRDTHTDRGTQTYVENAVSRIYRQSVQTGKCEYTYMGHTDIQGTHIHTGDTYTYRGHNDIQGDTHTDRGITHTYSVSHIQTGDTPTDMGHRDRQADIPTYRGTHIHTLRTQSADSTCRSCRRLSAITWTRGIHTNIGHTDKQGIHILTGGHTQTGSETHIHTGHTY